MLVEVADAVALRSTTQCRAPFGIAADAPLPDPTGTPGRPGPGTSVNRARPVLAGQSINVTWHPTGNRRPARSGSRLRTRPRTSDSPPRRAIQLSCLAHRAAT